MKNILENTIFTIITLGMFVGITILFVWLTGMVRYWYLSGPACTPVKTEYEKAEATCKGRLAKFEYEKGNYNFECDIK